MKIPRRAATAIPTVMTVGTARLNAEGDATMSTEIEDMTAIMDTSIPTGRLLVSRTSFAPKLNHATSVKAEHNTTMGTNHRPILSAKVSVEDFEPEYGSCTS